MAKHRPQRKHRRRNSILLKVGACLVTVLLIFGLSILNGKLYGSHPTTAHAEENPKTSIRITINGKTQRILATPHKTVKTALDSNNLTFQPGTEITPSLTEPVTEQTTITITSPTTKVETSEEPIPYNTVKKETNTLPKGQEKTQTEGQNGVMEATKLVTRTGDKVTASNVFAAQVKQPPVDKVVLVGTLDSKNTLGTTTPVSEIQKWAHDYLLANGYTEADFTAASHIINHESGWNPTATNPTSGAYGLGQALPGNKMAAYGDDWQTNYQTQFKWFIGYCQHYGGIQATYQHWITTGNY